MSDPRLSDEEIDAIEANGGWEKFIASDGYPALRADEAGLARLIAEVRAGRERETALRQQMDTQVSAQRPEWHSEIIEVIGGDIERRDVDQVGNRLDATGGWCTTHNDFAWLFRDGSIGCFRQATIHDSDTSSCRFLPLSEVLNDNP